MSFLEAQRVSHKKSRSRPLVHKPSGRSKLPPQKLWLAIFGLWFVLLSGTLAGVVGSPGAIQAIRLNDLLSEKQQQLLAIQDEIAKLEAEGERLEKSRLAQEREIRKVLGYASRDEIIFDFSNESQ